MIKGNGAAIDSRLLADAVGFADLALDAAKALWHKGFRIVENLEWNVEELFCNYRCRDCRHREAEK